MSDRDNIGSGMTKEEAEAHLQRMFQKHKEVRHLVDETKAARTRLLEKIIAQNLDRQLFAETVTRIEKALRIGFDPSNTKWPPPVLTYIEAHETVGHASILIEELLKQADRTLSTIESNLGLGAKEFEKQTWYEYADYILPARDEIEYALEGLRIGGLEKRLKDFRGRLSSFDARYRKALPESSKRYNEASGRYDLTGRDLEYFPQSFWWRRLGLTRKGEPV